MAPAVDQRPETRPILVLHSRETFSDDLGGFGERVPLRADVRSDKEAREDFVLRRVLAALEKLGEIPWPTEVWRGDHTDKQPDFVVANEVHHLLGIEVRMVTNENNEIILSDMEDALRRNDESIQGNRGCEIEFTWPDSSVGDNLSSDEIESITTSEIVKAIESKIKKLNHGNYSYTSSVWLCLYDNMHFERKSLSYSRDLTRMLRRALCQIGVHGFDRVFLMNFHDVVCARVDGSCEKIDLSDHYLVDFAAWANRQAQVVCDRKIDELDALNVAEELRCLGKSEARTRDRQLTELVFNLLMWQFHPSDRQREWHSAAVRYRFELEDLLDLSPSLDPRLQRIEEELALISEVYCGARRLASIETGLPATAFPETCPYTIDQILDPDFLPGPVRDEDLQP